MSNFEPISEHVFVDLEMQTKTRSSVLGAIALGENLLVIDSGNTLEDGQEIRKYLEGNLNLPVKYLFLTHTHSDHRGGMDAFTDTTIIMSQKTKENLPTNVRISKYTFQTFDETFLLESEGLQIEFRKFAGHTIGSSVAYCVQDKILFGGDLFFVGKKGNLGLPFLGFYQNKPRQTGNPDEYLTAYRTLMEYDLAIIIPGHGELVRNPHDYLNAQIQFFQALKDHFITAITNGLTFEEIDLPELEQITQAYSLADKEASRGKAIRFLDKYIFYIKKAFYNHYSKTTLTKLDF